MGIQGTPSLTTSAVQAIQSGDQELLQAVRQTASGSGDLARGAVDVMAARQSQEIGVKLARVADEMTKSTLDMLA
jgi:hypothetical protein